jgi:hypothetical protein
MRDTSNLAEQIMKLLREYGVNRRSVTAVLARLRRKGGC